MKTITVHQIVTHDVEVDEGMHSYLRSGGSLPCHKDSLKRGYFLPYRIEGESTEVLEMIDLTTWIMHDSYGPDFLSTHQIHKESYVAFDSSYKDVFGDVNKIVRDTKDSCNNYMNETSEANRQKEVIEKENTTLKRRIKYFTDLGFFERIKYAIKNKI